MDGYNLLAAAVVRQAAKDYRDLLVKEKYYRSRNISLDKNVRLESDNYYRSLNVRIKEFEDFFYDETNLLLRGIDGGAVVEKIRDSVANDKPITFEWSVF